MRPEAAVALGQAARVGQNVAMDRAASRRPPETA